MASRRAPLLSRDTYTLTRSAGSLPRSPVRALPSLAINTSPSRKAIGGRLLINGFMLFGQGTGFCSCSLYLAVVFNGRDGSAARQTHSLDFVKFHQVGPAGASDDGSRQNHDALPSTE